MTKVADRGAAPGAAGRERPRLAVLIPVFNDQVGLERSLASLADDGSRFDVFVVDDGSEPPISIPPDLPYTIRLVRQEPNQGITAALNAGLAPIVAGGYEYVARLDASDLSLPGRFAAQIAFLDRHPQHAIVGTATRYVDTTGALLFDFRPPTDHDALRRFLRYRAGIIHASVMLRLEALVACGCYRDQFPGGEDYDLFMRLGKRYKLANLDTIFIAVEIRQGSITSRRQRMLLCRLKLLATYFDPWSIHSYLGIIANAAFLLAPRSLVLKVRQLSMRYG